MKRIALLALFATGLTLSTAAGAATMPIQPYENASSYTGDYRPGEDWNDFAVRKGWWGHRPSEKVPAAAVAPADGRARGSLLRWVTADEEGPRTFYRSHFNQEELEKRF